MRTTCYLALSLLIGCLFVIARPLWAEDPPAIARFRDPGPSGPPQICWKDSDCPAYFICYGKLGVLDANGNCPPDSSCPPDPSQLQPGRCGYMNGSCDTDADCPPIARCTHDYEVSSVGQCSILPQ
jgi:hypothetical protein